MKVTMYVAPNGDKKTVEISNVLDEDREFFESNSVVISMEEIPSNNGVDFVVYADTGMENEDGDPEEFIEIAGGRSCKEVLHALRLSCEEYFKNGGGQ